MMNVNQIIESIKERISMLNSMRDIALKNLMRNDIDTDTFSMYEKMYDNAFERMTELNRLLNDIYTYDSECDGDSE